jgi:hypothetical protein
MIVHEMRYAEKRDVWVLQRQCGESWEMPE